MSAGFFQSLDDLTKSYSYSLGHFYFDYLGHYHFAVTQKAGKQAENGSCITKSLFYRGSCILGLTFQTDETPTTKAIACCGRYLDKNRMRHER